MRLSAFDIASRSTGYCSGDGLSMPVANAYAFPQFDNDFGALLDLWDKYLVTHFERFSPQAVVYEAPILVRTDLLRTVRKLYAMGAYLELFCLRHGVECSEVTLQSIKKEVAGTSSAKKADMVLVAKRCGVQLPKQGYEDAADAWGAWLIALRTYNKPASAKWDKILMGSKGKLL